MQALGRSGVRKEWQQGLQAVGALCSGGNGAFEPFEEESLSLQFVTIFPSTFGNKSCTVNLSSVKSFVILFKPMDHPPFPGLIVPGLSSGVASVGIQTTQSCLRQSWVGWGMSAGFRDIPVIPVQRESRLLAQRQSWGWDLGPEA